MDKGSDSVHSQAKNEYPELKIEVPKFFSLTFQNSNLYNPNRTYVWFKNGGQNCTNICSVLNLVGTNWQRVGSDAKAGKMKKISHPIKHILCP